MLLAKTISGLLALIMLTACNRPPALVDYKWPVSELDQEKIDAAPLVVVAQVLSDRREGSLLHSRWRPEVLYTISRLTLRVENVLRGDMQPGIQEVFYFQLNSAVGPRLLGVWPPNARFVFLMNRDGGVIRLASDGYGYCERHIYSGKHPYYRPAPNESLDYMVADLALVQGEGCSDQEFVRGFPWIVNTVPTTYLLPKFKMLAGSKSTVIAKAACLSLRNDLGAECPTASKCQTYPQGQTCTP